MYIFFFSLSVSLSVEHRLFFYEILDPDICLTPLILSFLEGEQMIPKRKLFENLRRNTDSRVVAKFGENRTLGS